MNAVRRGWLVVALVAAVLALAGSVAAVAAGVGRGPAVVHRPTGAGSGAGGYGPGMMGGSSGGYGPGMMGGSSGSMMGAGAWQSDGRYGLPGDGQPVTTLAGAKARAQVFADRLGDRLHAGEVMQFSNGFYVELFTAAGAGATEVLVDPGAGAVTLEYGPAMMWNTRYGMHATRDVPARVSAAAAVTGAQAWLDARRLGLTAGDATAFPGYYTLHTMKDGRIVGMMSVHAVGGAIWYHTWHGTFVARAGEQA